MSLCLVRLIEPVFRSIKHCVSGFFKNSSLTDSNTFSKSFFKIFSLSPTWQGCTKIFCRFLPQFLQGFSPSRPVRPFYPSFCSYFHVFMHFFMHLKGISIDISLYCVLFEIKILFFFTCIFSTHAVMHFV